MDNITVVILTKNEESNILDCLESLQEFKNIIIIDDFSTDRTVEVVESKKYSNVKIFKHSLDFNFAAQRNFSLSKVKTDWAFFLDADERVTSELVNSIKGSVADNDTNGFLVKRVDIMWGTELKHGENGNAKFIRLGRKNSGKWSGEVHEIWNIKGKVGQIDNALMHYPHPTLFDFIKEVDFYSTLRARELGKKGVKIKFTDIIIYPKAKFIQNYFIKLGFLDGIPGLIVALIMSMHSFLVRSRLWRKTKT